MKITNIDREFLHIFWNDLKTLSEIFRKNVFYDNIKSHKKQGFTLSLEDTFPEKQQGWSN